MTDGFGINSADRTFKDINGKIINNVRDSLLSETLLSLIITVTILSLLSLVKCYIQLFDVSQYPQYTLLIVAVAHTLIRRIRIRSVTAILILHILVSCAFYFAVISFPALEYGTSLPNRIYLIISLAGFTVFSVVYRLKPTFVASETEIMAFPGAVHAIGYILFSFTGLKDNVREILTNAVIVAAIFVIMRQIAVFDAKYYHSIHKISRSSSQLRKQNYKTVAGLTGIIAVSLAVLVIFPYSLLTDLIKPVLAAVIRAILKFLFYLLSRGDSAAYEEETAMHHIMMPDSYGDDVWLDIIAKVVMLIAFAVFSIVLIKIVRAVIQNMPKYRKPEEISDDNLVDTIENIAPVKKHFFTAGMNFGSGYERRIRKRFYDKTRRAMKKGLPVADSSTPGQIEAVLLANGDNDIITLRKEYEKVRYGERYDKKRST